MGCGSSGVSSHVVKYEVLNEDYDSWCGCSFKGREGSRPMSVTRVD